MDLPKKDKNGIGYLSYSQISLFKKSKEDYYDQYILNKPFIGNEYTEFGKRVESAIESCDYSGFSKCEADVLKNVTRLDLFQRMTILRYEGFYVIGYADTVSENLLLIIDYKTGGHGKHKQYELSTYDQLAYYALAIRQETGITPNSARVEFITRAQSPKGKTFCVAQIPPIIINVDISIDKLKQVYHDTKSTAKQIEEFYIKNR